MAERSSADVEIIWLGGHDVRPYLTQASLTLEYMSEEDYKLGDDYVYFAPLLITKVMQQVNGFFDDGADAIQAALEDISGGTVPGLIGFSGNVQGRRVVAFEKYTQGQFNNEVARGEFVKTSSQAEGVGEYWMMNVINVVETITASQNGANYDESSDYPGGTSDGGRVFLGVTELDLDGAADLTLEVEQGDGVTMVLIPGLTQAFTADNAVILNATGQTVGEVVRCAATFGAGGGGGETAKIVAAWIRN